MPQLASIISSKRSGDPNETSNPQRRLREDCHLEHQFVERPLAAGAGVDHSYLTRYRATAGNHATDVKMTLAALGYASAHCRPRQWNGVATASRWKWDVIRDLEGAVTSIARTTARCALLAVSSCHVPEGRELRDSHHLHKSGRLASLRET